jgi:hypothetical protein
MAIIEVLGAGLMASKFARIGIALAVLTILWVVVFPTVELPEQVATSLETVAGYLAPFGTMLPITTMFTILSLILTFEAGLVAFKVFNWLWELD